MTTKLTPEMLLFEVACMLSRHGIPATPDNPTAAVHAATLMLRSLGVPVDAPLPELPAISATAAHPIVAEDKTLGPVTPQYDRTGQPLPLPTRSPLARLQQGGQHRVLRLAPDGGNHA